jgi:hypothetical protein
MAVRKHVTKEDLKKRFAQIDSFMKEPLKKQDCDLFGALAVSLRTGRAVGGAKQELLTQFLNDKDRAREMMKVLDPLVTFCRNPTLENARRVIEAEYDKDMRTCYVSVNPFRQSFTLNVSSGHWEHVSPPDGACGVVQLTYFEKAPDAAANLPFWRWVTSKKILNKEATDLFGKCSGLDEAEYVYDWHSTENLMHCDFIQFDVL